MDAIEQAAWDASQAAATEPEVAPATPDATPESDAAAHTTVAEEVVEEVNGEEVADEATESPETEETAESATDFQELLDDLPTKEAILAKFNRIPNDAKEFMVTHVEQQRALRDQIQSIGGEEGLGVYQKVNEFLLSPEPTFEQSAGAFAAMFEKNPLATASMVIDSSSHFLRSNEPGIRDVGNKIVADVFGDGITVGHLHNLLQLEKAGLVNVEEDMRALMSDGNSSLYQTQQSTLEQQQARIRELEDLVKNPEKITKQSEVKAGDDFTADLEAKFDEAISQVIEKARWTGSNTLKSVVKNAILAEIKNDPQYKAALKAASQGRDDWSVRTSKSNLVNMAKAKYIKAVQGVSEDLKGFAANSRNNIVKNKTEQTKPKSISLTPKQSPFAQTRTPIDEIEAAAFRDSGLAAFTS